MATAKKIIDDDFDWTFNIAYNAMLQAARALMLSKGYRATGERQHMTTIQFAQLTLGTEFQPALEFLDRMRRKRNRAVYDTAGLISKVEAQEAIATADNFVDDISDVLQ